MHADPKSCCHDTCMRAGPSLKHVYPSRIRGGISDHLAPHLPLSGKTVSREGSLPNLFHDYWEFFRPTHRLVHCFQLDQQQTINRGLSGVL